MTEFQSETDDLIRVIQLHGLEKFGRCAGWRLVMPGRACDHCGSANPRAECLAPGPSREARAVEMLRG